MSRLWHPRSHNLRELPRATGRALLPPCDDYEYFVDGSPPPLDETGFPAGLIAWLADASLLAYSPKSIQRRAIEPIGGSVHDVRCARRDDAAALLRFDLCTVVSFRGTRIQSLRDLVSDLTFELVRHPNGGSVHRGFLEAYRDLRPSLAHELESAPAGRPKIFTGHSLGGALATLAAADFGADVLATFGCPRVGEAVFRRAFDREKPRVSWRVVHADDPVPHLPPRSNQRAPRVAATVVAWAAPLWTGRYRHVGSPCWIGADGSAALDGATWRRMRPRWSVRVLDDHSPLLYAVRAQNLVGGGTTSSTSP